MTNDTIAPVRIEAWADVACPWCFIGAVRLDAVVAGEHAAGREVVVRHRPFQLSPELPPEGRPLREFFESRFGGRAAVDDAFARVAAVGAEVGIVFAQESMPKVANTRLAHALLLTYDGDTRQQRALRALFSAYFEQCLDITDRDVVVGVVAGATGEQAEQVAARFTDAAVQALDDALDASRALGITAVPTFVADAGVPDADDVIGLSSAAVAVQGAQPTETLQQLLTETRRRAGS